MDLELIIAEVKDYMDSLETGKDGEHLWSQMEEIAAMTTRLQQIRNDLAAEEILGRASPEMKKVRTLLIDSTLDRLDKLSAFESRKLSARKIEEELER